MTLLLPLHLYSMHQWPTDGFNQSRSTHVLSLILVFYLLCFKSPSGVDLLTSPYAVRAKKTSHIWGMPEGDISDYELELELEWQCQKHTTHDTDEILGCCTPVV